MDVLLRLVLAGVLVTLAGAGVASIVLLPFWLWLRR